MALNDDNRDNHDDVALDPQLARLLETASGEMPPAALDAAILAAARRAVHAGPQVAGGGSSSAVPVRSKRNWYVPVSIAAVLVMSASLVMVVHEEKTDDMVQSPRQASIPEKPAPPPVAAPESAPAPAAEAAGPAPSASNDKREDRLRDTVPAEPKLAQRPVVTGELTPAPSPPLGAERIKKQRVEKAESVADSARRDKSTVAAAPESEATGRAGVVPGAPAVRSPAPVEARPPAEPFPATASRDAVQARARSETDQAGGMRGPVQSAPQDAAPAVAASAPRRAAPAAEVAAPAAAENRALAVPPPPAPNVAAKPMAPLAKSMLRAMAWRGLEDQPPEKWLERVAEFKRDGRLAETDEIMNEFRRRFPEHPASVR